MKYITLTTAGLLIAVFFQNCMPNLSLETLDVSSRSPSSVNSVLKEEFTQSNLTPYIRGFVRTSKKEFILYGVKKVFQSDIKEHRARPYIARLSKSGKLLEEKVLKTFKNSSSTSSVRSLHIDKNDNLYIIKSELERGLPFYSVEKSSGGSFDFSKVENLDQSIFSRPTSSLHHVDVANPQKNILEDLTVVHSGYKPAAGTAQKYIDVYQNNSKNNWQKFSINTQKIDTISSIYKLGDDLNLLQGYSSGALKVFSHSNSISTMSAEDFVSPQCNGEVSHLYQSSISTVDKNNNYIAMLICNYKNKGNSYTDVYVMAKTKDENWTSTKLPRDSIQHPQEIIPFKRKSFLVFSKNLKTGSLEVYRSDNMGKDWSFVQSEGDQGWGMAIFTNSRNNTWVLNKHKYNSFKIYKVQD